VWWGCGEGVGGGSGGEVWLRGVVGVWGGWGVSVGERCGGEVGGRSVGEYGGEERF